MAIHVRARTRGNGICVVGALDPLPQIAGNSGSMKKSRLLTGLPSAMKYTSPESRDRWEWSSRVARAYRKFGLLRLDLMTS